MTECRPRGGGHRRSGPLFVTRSAARSSPPAPRPATTRVRRRYRLSPTARLSVAPGSAAAVWRVSPPGWVPVRRRRRGAPRRSPRQRGRPARGRRFARASRPSRWWRRRYPFPPASPPRTRSCLSRHPRPARTPRTARTPRASRSQAPAGGRCRGPSRRGTPPPRASPASPPASCHSPSGWR